MEKNDGPPELAQTITNNLTAWRQQRPFPQLPENRWIQKAVLSQDDIGWRNFLVGFCWNLVLFDCSTTIGVDETLIESIRC